MGKYHRLSSTEHLITYHMLWGDERTIKRTHDISSMLYRGLKKRFRYLCLWIALVCTKQLRNASSPLHTRAIELILVLCLVLSFFSCQTVWWLLYGRNVKLGMLWMLLICQKMDCMIENDSVCLTSDSWTTNISMKHLHVKSF